MRIILLIAFLALISSSVSAIEPAQYFRINQVLAKKHILPRYENFSAQAIKLDLAAQQFCMAPSIANLPLIKTAFHSAADAWAGVQHIQFGPIEEKLRLNRVYYWPDKHNTGSRHLGRLLKSEDETLLSEEQFSLISVALQGFPALERLLFSQSEKLFKQDKTSMFRCSLVQAISLNLRKISAAVLNEWNDPSNGFMQVATSSGVPIYSGENEIFQDHLASLYGNLRAIHNLKIHRTLGENSENSRPRLAEAWRSERSLRNIILNLEAAQKLFEGEGAFGMDDFIEMLKPDSNTAKDFKTYMEYTLKTARSISLPLHKAVRDEQQHEQVERLKAQVLALMGLVRGRISTAVGMGTGFNFLDGD